MITATDIKQYIFCPRTVYLYHVLHIPSRFSQKMKKGQKVHEEILGEGRLSFFGWIKKRISVPLNSRSK